MPKIIELRQNRNYIRSNFDGYKLSLESVPLHKQELVSSSPPYQAAPNDEQYSLLHAELFSMQNLLQSDPWLRTHAYYINSLGQIVKISYNSNTGMPHPIEIVYRLGLEYLEERQHGDYNYSLRFISEKYCLLCDGIQSLTLFDTGVRELKSTEWKIITKCRISDNKLKQEENRNFLILDSRLDILQEQKTISIALAHVQRIDERQQSDASSSISSSCSHYMYIHWCTLSVNNNSWKFSILDTLETKGLIYYCAFEPRGESLIVCSNRDILWRSSNNVKVSLTNPRLGDKPQLHMEPNNFKEVEMPDLTWSQTVDDLTIKFPIMLNKDKTDYTVKCDNKWMKVKCNDEILLDQELYEKIDHDLTTWTIENNFVQINLMKTNSNIHWPQLLAHTAEPKEEVENKTSGDIASMEQKPIANLEAPIEDCDFPLYSAEDEISMHRFHLPTRTITHSILFGNTPPIFTTSLRPGYPAAFATRQDVDACLWLQHYQSQKTDDDIWSIRHEGNLHAFGYIQASKQQKKFIDCSPDLNYSLICESHRHIFLYKSKYETADGLRNRNGPQISLGKQHLITLEYGLGEILGLTTANNVTIVLTEKCILFVQIT